jgi:hypothetical protein
MDNHVPGLGPCHIISLRKDAIAVIGSSLSDVCCVGRSVDEVLGQRWSTNSW